MTFLQARADYLLVRNLILDIGACRGLVQTCTVNYGGIDADEMQSFCCCAALHLSYNYLIHVRDKLYRQNV